MNNYHYFHIPLTGGDNLMNDSPSFLPQGTKLQKHVGRAFSEAQRSFAGADNHYSVTLLRRPISHVLSLFLECKYNDPEVRDNFPGIKARTNPLAGFSRWLRHFADRKGDSFGCVNPWNVQSRHLASSGIGSKGITQKWRPNISLALENLDDINVLGITEYYAASLCLFQYHASGSELSEECRYCDPETQSLSLVKEKLHPIVSDTPIIYNMSQIPPETYEQLQRVARLDEQLYAAGFVRFFQSIEQVRLETGMDLLCRNTRPVHAQTEIRESSSNPVLLSISLELLGFLVPVAFLLLWIRSRINPRRPEGRTLHRLKK